jgi:hypothetical protein
MRTLSTKHNGWNAAVCGLVQAIRCGRIDAVTPLVDALVENGYEDMAQKVNQVREGLGYHCVMSSLQLIGSKRERRRRYCLHERMWLVTRNLVLSLEEALSISLFPHDRLRSWKDWLQVSALFCRVRRAELELQRSESS